MRERRLFFCAVVVIGTSAATAEEPAVDADGIPKTKLSRALPQGVEFVETPGLPLMTLRSVWKRDWQNAKVGDWAEYVHEPGTKSQENERRTLYEVGSDGYVLLHEVTWKRDGKKATYATRTSFIDKPPVEPKNPPRVTEGVKVKVGSRELVCRVEEMGGSKDTHCSEVPLGGLVLMEGKTQVHTQLLDFGRAK
jgi:hypothetical protein